MEKVKYFGCFFNADDLKGFNFKGEPLDRAITTPHITLIYRPEDYPKELIGREVEVRVIGYGNNGENEALSVEFVNLLPELCEIVKQIDVLHITLSVAKTSRSVKSKYLSFESIPPFVLRGVIGVMDEDKKVHISI